MWRRLYIPLLLVRLYFALSPSYIHPDEHFQGLEVIAGDIFGWRSQRTWEFTSDSPIRSFFPLWFVYGIPMQMLDWVVPDPSPELTFKFLRLLFFLMSFVLEDWSLQDLLTVPRRRHLSLVLLASSYVTWTYQTHTFSNSVETINVLWALVLMERIRKSERTPWIASALLGFVCAFGVFNRITFPAFLLLPAYRLIPHFLQNPLSLIPLILTALLTAAYAIYLDTLFYRPASPISLFHPSSFVVTPLNSLLYNTQTSNLAEHGLHPRYTHLLVNLPQLLGPALVSFVPSLSRRHFDSFPVLSAISGIAVLSVLPHQEARFLTPAVPLLLAATPLPSRPVQKRIWLAAWVIFNSLFGLLMGAYHQSGLVPVQSFLGRQTNATDIIYWKTYKPPTWLLGPPAAGRQNWEMMDLMGAPVEKLAAALDRKVSCKKGRETYLVAPTSAEKLDPLVDDSKRRWKLEKVWKTKRHLNLDDLDIGEEGLVGTWRRVVGRRGLGVWRVKGRRC